MEAFLVVTIEAKILLASSGQRPGVTLSILQYTGQPPTMRNKPSSNIKSSEAERSGLKDRSQTYSSLPEPSQGHYHINY